MSWDDRAGALQPPNRCHHVDRLDERGRFATPFAPLAVRVHRVHEKKSIADQWLFV
jgi:hypothetical protein